MRTAQLLALFLLPTAAVCQAEIIGLTHKTQYLHRQQMGGSCSSTTCVASNQAQVSGTAGGTAFDGRTGIVWVTNGTLLDGYNVPDGTAKACAKICTQQKIPPVLSTSVTWCTGMTCLEAGTLTASGSPGATSRLYFLYSNGFIVWTDLRGCTLTSTKTCNASGFLGTNSAAGIACDDINRLLFVSTTLSSGANVIYVLDADNPCNQASCRIGVSLSSSICPNTSFGAIRGLAYDACRKMLFATDGTTVIYGLVTRTQTSAGGWICSFQHLGCCASPSELYTGIAALPPAQQSDGKPCSVSGCNACSPITSTTGRAVLGNANFSFNLDNAPANTTTYVLAIGLGPCSATGIGLGFCQPVRVALAAPGPLLFFFGTGPVLSTCGGKMSIPAPLSINPAACGQSVSFQWLMPCKTGHAMSDCRTFTISGI